ncbi:MAG: hypothetical protein ACREA0_12015 [bacterium]
MPEAPVEGRYSSTAVWTGTEFVVFGGHSFDESFVDGAAFDPASETWRHIAGAPVSMAAILLRSGPDLKWWFGSRVMTARPLDFL